MHPVNSVTSAASPAYVTSFTLLDIFFGLCLVKSQEEMPHLHPRLRQHFRTSPLQQRIACNYIHNIPRPQIPVLTNNPCLITALIALKYLLFFKANLPCDPLYFCPHHTSSSEPWLFRTVWNKLPYIHNTYPNLEPI